MSSAVQVPNAFPLPRSEDLLKAVIRGINTDVDWSAQRFIDEARAMVTWAERDNADWVLANRECRKFCDYVELVRSEAERGALRWFHGIAPEPAVNLPLSVIDAFYDLAERLLDLTRKGEA